MDTKDKITELASNVETLKFKTREQVARANGAVFVVSAMQLNDSPSPKQLMQEIKGMGFKVVNQDQEKPAIQEIDFRIDIESVKMMLDELGRTQDELYELSKIALSNG